MKILMVISEMPPITSGVANCGARLVEGLRNQGHDVDVVAAPAVPRWIVGEFRFSSFVRSWPQIRHSLREFDVVNVHGPAPSLSDAFLALAQTISPVRRPPIVYTHHSSIELKGLLGASIAYNKLNGRLMRYADRVVVTSESYRQIVLKEAKCDATVISWGVDTELFEARERVERRPGGPLRVLFVGQMRPYKGVDQLVGAVAGAEQLELTVVGDGPLAPHVVEMIERLGAKNVHYAGRLADDELRATYARHDVIALPSTTRAEAFGLVLLEGMAAGCVPVGSDLPGVRDVAGPTGLVVPPGDPAALRAALLRLAENQTLLGELSLRSAERARELTWENVIARYEHILASEAERAQDRLVARTLSFPKLSPDAILSYLKLRFRATDASLLLFGGDTRSDEPVTAWGPFVTDDFETVPPVIDRFVVQHGKGILLDGQHTPSDLRPLLKRSDIASALAVPVKTSRGYLVLNLSISSKDGRPRYRPSDLREVVTFLS